MILREIDKSTIYIAHLVGYNEYGEPIYTKPIQTKAQVSENTKGEIVISNNGVSEQYNLKLAFEYNKINKFIDEHTIFWINTSAIDKEHNYIPVKINKWENNIAIVYVNYLERNWDSVWCYSEIYGFYEIQCFIDEENLNLILPENSFFNNTIMDRVWLEKPNSVDDTNGLYFVNDYYKLQDEIIYMLTKGE